MSKSIRRFLSFLLVLQLIIPYSTFAAAVGEFTSVVGNVTQTRAKKVITPVAKSPIELKDLIVTARTSSATMVFPDDSTITLSENTKLEIKEFLFKDKSRKGIFSLEIGKLTANVKKYIGGNNVFEVNSPTVGVGVRGTGFEFVEAMRDGKVASNAANQRMATVSCTEGSLNLSAFSATGAVISTAVLEAGQIAVIIGGVITISMIGAADATGGAAAATTGLSKAAIAGIAIGGTAAVVATAAAIGSSGGGGSSSSGGGGSATSVTSRNVQICVVDSNSIQDDYYDLYVNGTYVGPVRNPVGGTTCYPATLVSGNNTILLKLTQTNCCSTYLTITANPGGWSSIFSGASDHTWNITAP